MANTSNGATGVIAVVQRDHKEIERMLDDVESTSGPDRERAFDALVRKLLAHESAEQQVVHPLGEQAGADEVEREVEVEEQTAEQALKKFDDLDVNSDEFRDAFHKLKRDVKAHAQHEERDEHPRIVAEVPRQTLERLAQAFEEAEQKA
jgi:Hemerythrin HHE cation binding domain